MATSGNGAKRSTGGMYGVTIRKQKAFFNAKKLETESLGGISRDKKILLVDHAFFGGPRKVHEEKGQSIGVSTYVDRMTMEAPLVGQDIDITSAYRDGDILGGEDQLVTSTMAASEVHGCALKGDTGEVRLAPNFGLLGGVPFLSVLAMGVDWMNDWQSQTTAPVVQAGDEGDRTASAPVGIDDQQDQDFDISCGGDVALEAPGSGPPQACHEAVQLAGEPFGGCCSDSSSCGF